MFNIFPRFYHLILAIPDVSQCAFAHRRQNRSNYANYYYANEVVRSQSLMDESFAKRSSLF